MKMTNDQTISEFGLVFIEQTIKLFSVYIQTLNARVRWT